MKTLNQLVGPADYVWNECEPRTTRLTDLPGKDIFFVAHHAYDRTLTGIIATFKSPYRSVSANVAVGPLIAGRDAYVARHTVPWNTHRAYTTASWIDDQALTFEMANLSLEPPYRVGQTGKQWAAEVAAAMHVELGMPLDRWHVTCHQEVYQRGWGSYATACPGDDLHDALDWIVAEAKRIVAAHYANPTLDKEILMALEARYVYRTEGNPEYMLLDEDLPPLATDLKQDGYRVSTKVEDGEAYGILAGRDNGAPIMGLKRDKYNYVQVIARQLAGQKRAARQAELVKALKAAAV